MKLQSKLLKHPETTNEKISQNKMIKTGLIPREEAHLQREIEKMNRKIKQNHRQTNCYQT